MRLVSFGEAGQESPGVLLPDDRIVDLTAATRGELRTIRQLLEGGAEALTRISALLAAGPANKWLLDAGAARLGPPVTNPSKIIGLGLNYRSHIEEVKARHRDAPLIFSKAVTSLAGDGDPIWYPVDEENLDYEAELAFVIGRSACRIAAADWHRYVVGYTIVNDVSARDAQFADRKWFRGKSYDSFCPMGPTLVTADEVPDPHALRVTTHLNGELRQDGHTSDLVFRIPDVLAYVSRNITLRAGDVIATGTPGGVGIFRKPPACMQIGDEVTVEIEGLGRLTNRIRERTSVTSSVYPTP